MNPNEARVALNTGLAILGLVALRLIAAAFTPITFDEAYYWMWSKHLAGGYYDHPPVVAVVIRLGTLIAGDTEFGVRLVSILLALPMSWAIYQAAAILFGSRRVAASSAILLNITLMAAVGTMIVTPDAPLLVASSLLLFALAKVLQTGRGVWWLAVGAAAGCALLSKYTALFFGPAILIWLVAVPKLRHWLISPWLYLGGLVALVLFAPVILWNAEHHWVSFIKQMGRARIEDFRPVFIAELIPTQIAFATPLVWMLGAMGLYALFRRRAGALPARVLVNTMFWVIVAYFVWHSLHARVEANWFAPVYPAFAIAAAVAAHLVEWEPRWQRAGRFLPALGGAGRRPDVRAAGRAGRHRRAVGLSPRCHRAQRRRRLARNGRRDRSGEGANGSDMRAGARTTAPPAGSPSICRRAPAWRSRASASAGSTCPSPMRRSSPARCSMSARPCPAMRPSEGHVRPRREGRARSSASAARW